MKKTLILCTIIVTLFSCSKDNESNPTEVKIRLSNTSQYNFQNIVVNTATEEKNIYYTTNRLFWRNTA